MSVLTAIGQISLRVSDLDRAVAFYRDRLGLPYLFSAPPGLAFFQCGEVRLMLALPEGPGSEHSGSILYYRVADLPGAHAGLAARGVEFVADPHLIATLPDHELWMAFARDSEGNTFALMSEVR